MEPESTAPDSLRLERYAPPDSGRAGWIYALNQIVAEMHSLRGTPGASRELSVACTHIEDGLRRLQYMEANWPKE